MASVNKVILLGNLGKDPELRYTPQGRAVVNFSLATSERWTSKADGTKQEKTEWHNIVLWDRQAEIANQYLKKGSSCFIEGRITNRSWEDADKNKRYRTEIIGTSLQLMSGGSGGGGGPPRLDDSSAPPQREEYFDAYPAAEYSSSSGGDTASGDGGGEPSAGGGDDLPF